MVNNFPKICTPFCASTTADDFRVKIRNRTYAKKLYKIVLIIIYTFMMYHCRSHYSARVQVFKPTAISWLYSVILCYYYYFNSFFINIYSFFEVVTTILKYDNDGFCFIRHTHRYYVNTVVIITSIVAISFAYRTENKNIYVLHRLKVKRIDCVWILHAVMT